MQQQIRVHFQTTDSIAMLGVGLFNFGSIFGPLIGGPLSEPFGCRPVYIGASVGLVFFSLAAAPSSTMLISLACCALAGFVGSTVFALYGGSLTGIFGPEERGSFVALFTIVLQGTPTIGPVPSSLLGTIVHWHWPMGFIAAWAAITTAVVICLAEVEINAIRRRIAKQQNLDVPKGSGPLQPSGVWRQALLTPITMLQCEPIVIWPTLYHAVVYGLLFLLLEAYPLVYKSHYSMSRQQAGSVFVAPWLGNLLGVLLYFRVLRPQYMAHRHAIRVQSSGKRDILPEGCLPGVSLSSHPTRSGMFWFASSARPSVYWLIPVTSGIPVGMGMTLLQLSLLNYYIGLYPSRSASVIAANCAVRNVVSTISPSLGVPLYTYFWICSATLLACINCLGFPTALILHLCGKRLRAASSWAKQDVAEVSDAAYFNAVAPLVNHLPQPTYGGTDSSN